MTNSFLTIPISQKLTEIIPHFLFSFSSPHTRRSYLNDLKGFSDFIKINHPNIHFLNEIDDICVSLWKKHLENDLKLDPASVRRKLNCLSALFVFAQKRKYIDINPVQWVKKPAQKNISSTNALSPNDMKMIFSNITNKILFLQKNHTNKIHYKRTLQSYEMHYVVLKLLYGTGLRVSEICQIRLSDLEIQTNIENEKIFILHIKQSKGGKEHKVFLNIRIAEIVLNYISKYRKEAPLEDSLFVRTQQNANRNSISPLTPKTVYSIVATNAREANITKKVSPHSIRAGVATYLHEKGVPLARIQKQLGHSDISTTSVYIKKSNEIEESAALKLNLEDSDFNQ